MAVRRDRTGCGARGVWLQDRRALARPYWGLTRSRHAECHLRRDPETGRYPSVPPGPKASRRLATGASSAVALRSAGQVHGEDEGVGSGEQGFGLRELSEADVAVEADRAHVGGADGQ